MRAVVLLALLLAAAPSARAAGLLERDHPEVQRGRAAYEAGDYEAALRAFDRAGQERPGDPAVEFNRGDALTKLGRYDEAAAAFGRVLESGRTDLKQRAHYNLGTLYAMAGEREASLRELRRALVLDPHDAAARRNLEVVLRNLPPPRPPDPDAGSDGGADGGRDGGSPDAGRGDGGAPDGGQDGGADGGTRDGGTDGGPQDGGSPDGGADGGADGGPSQKGDGGADGGADAGPDEQGTELDGGTDGGSEGETDEVEEGDGGVDPRRLSKDEAERLLDAMKQNERNLQLWRFQQKKKQRNPDAKDW